MCTLAFCKERKMTFEEFLNCHESNGDGIGIGFCSDGKQVYVKGFMTFDEAWKAYQKLPDGPHVIHFRLGTAGAKSRELTHPFICSDDSELELSYRGETPILFHNGMIWKYEAYCKKHNIAINDRMSDTRMVAMMISKYGMKKAMQHFDGKFIVLHSGGRALMKGDFIYENGIYFSNTYYKYSFKRNWNKNYSCTVDDVYPKTGTNVPKVVSTSTTPITKGTTLSKNQKDKLDKIPVYGDDTTKNYTVVNKKKTYDNDYLNLTDEEIFSMYKTK